MRTLQSQRLFDELIMFILRFTLNLYLLPLLLFDNVFYYDHYKTLLITHSLIDMVITKPKSLSFPLRKISNEIMNFHVRKNIFLNYFQIPFEQKNLLKHIIGINFRPELKQVAGPACGACSRVIKNIAYRKQTEKLKLKIAIIAAKQVPVIYLGVISLDSKFQLSRSSNNSDMNKSFRVYFCHQEGSRTILKYSFILG